MFILKTGIKEIDFWVDFIDFDGSTMIFKTKEEAEKQLKSYVKFHKKNGSVMDHKIVEVEYTLKEKK